MRNYLAFLAKEIVEGAKTYKAVILLAVFLILGIMNPLFAKLMPELIGTLGTGGISITLPEPSATDSWMQFFKNMSPIGFLVVIILFSGILSQEISKGTLINMVTKGLSRTTVILSKYSYLILAWTAAYGFCLAVTLGYTAYLFPGGDISNLAFALFALWVFGVLLVSFLMFCASASKSSYACLLGTGAFVVALMTLGIVPAAHDYNPYSLVSDSNALMAASVEPSSLVPAIAIALAGSAALVIASVLVFRKRQL